MLNLILFSFIYPLILVAGLFFSLSSAATEPTQTLPFGIRPQTSSKGYFVYTIVAGGKVQDVLLASNPNEVPLSFNVWVARGKTMNAGGISFADEASGAGQWITFPDAGTITVPPTTTLSLPFEVSVPAGTPPGEYVVGFLATAQALPAETDSPPDGSDGPGFEVIVISRVGVAMVITVPEANRCEAAISSLTSTSKNGRWQLGINMQNSGNVHFNSTGEVIAWPVGDNKPMVQKPFSVGYFIPSDAITYSLALEPYPAPGEYDIDVNLITNCGFQTTYRQRVSVDQYTVTVSAAPEAGGVVEGGGSYPLGAGVLVTATANIGYSFTNWSESGTVVSTDASYSFTATTSRALDANFISSITPLVEIGLVKGVGVLADVCADTNNIAVLPGEIVYSCYTITNTGNMTLTMHTLVDELAGVILTDTLAALAPGQTLSTLQLGKVISAEVAVTTTTVATWTATVDGENLSATANATATVALGRSELALEEKSSFTPLPNSTGTVGGEIHYDITVRNVGTTTLKNVKVSFVVPDGTLFFTEPYLSQSIATFSATTPGWDCPKDTPAGTTCTTTLALLPPEESISFRVTLLVIREIGAEGIIVEFSATTDGTRLTPGPSADLVVASPHDVQGIYLLYLPKIMTTIPPFPWTSD